MTVHFTEQEKDWIDMIPFDWKIKKGCPDSIKESLEKKLEQLKRPQGPVVK